MTTLYQSVTRRSPATENTTASGPPIDRRQLGIGLFAFIVAGREILLTPGEAHAQGAVFKTLKAEEVAALQGVGETLVPDAKKLGIAEFVDHQLSIPAEEALLQARIFNVRPPFANFYRAALGAVDRAAKARHADRTFAQLTADEQRAFVDDMRQMIRREAIALQQHLIINRLAAKGNNAANVVFKCHALIMRNF